MKKKYILSPNKIEVTDGNKISTPLLPTTVVMNNGHYSWVPYASSTVGCTLSGSQFSTLTVVPNNSTVSLAGSTFTNFFGKIRVFTGANDLLQTNSVLPAGCVVEVHGLASFQLSTANQSNAVNYYLFGTGSATNGALKLGSSSTIGASSNIYVYNNNTTISGTGTINAQIVDDGTGYSISRIGSLTNTTFGTTQTATRDLNLGASTYTTLANGVT